MSIKFKTTLYPQDSIRHLGEPGLLVLRTSSMVVLRVRGTAGHSRDDVREERSYRRDRQHLYHLHLRYVGQWSAQVNNFMLFLAAKLLRVSTVI